MSVDSGRRFDVALLVLRSTVALIFVSEGLQKLLFEAPGSLRFERIGFPMPDVVAHAVGTTEVICGTLVALGAWTRLATVPLAATMVGALLSTKVPILLGRGYAFFEHTFAPKEGGWDFLHEARTDFAMLACTTCLVLLGAGMYSFDARRRAT